MNLLMTSRLAFRYKLRLKRYQAIVLLALLGYVPLAVDIFHFGGSAKCLVHPQVTIGVLVFVVWQLLGCVILSRVNGFVAWWMTIQIFFLPMFSVVLMQDGFMGICSRY